MEMHDITKSEYAPLYGGVIAFLRAWQRGKRWRGRCIEGSLMALSLVCVVPALEAFGVKPVFALAFAGWAGYVGTDALSAWVGSRMGV